MSLHQIRPLAKNRLKKFVKLWEAAGSKIEIMDPNHHDQIMAMTSHLPHLISYTIVGTATDLERSLVSEVVKYSAGGFRDFTRVAASRSNNVGGHYDKK